MSNPRAAAPLDDRQIEAWATTLTMAGEEAVPIAPLSEREAALTADSAYAIARCGVDARVAAGARIVGHKIGLTSTAVQQQLGVDEPDYGTLLDVMAVPDNGTVAAARLIAPRVELELAFHLAEDLAGPAVTTADVRRATAAVQPAIELVDSRIRDWRIKLVDTVADNASAAGFVLGGRRCSLDEISVADIDSELWRDDELVERGHSGAVLGDPCVAVAWLANALARFETSLKAGQVILSGACTRMVVATPGTRFEGRFGALGTVGISIGGMA